MTLANDISRIVLWLTNFPAYRRHFTLRDVIHDTRLPRNRALEALDDIRQYGWITRTSSKRRDSHQWRVEDGLRGLDPAAINLLRRVERAGAKCNGE